MWELNVKSFQCTSRDSKSQAPNYWNVTVLPQQMMIPTQGKESLWTTHWNDYIWELRPLELSDKYKSKGRKKVILFVSPKKGDTGMHLTNHVKLSITHICRHHTFHGFTTDWCTRNVHTMPYLLWQEGPYPLLVLVYVWDTCAKLTHCTLHTAHFLLTTT